VYYLYMTSNLVLSDVRVVLCITLDITFNRVHMLGSLVYYLDMISNWVQMLGEPSVLSRYDP
jgi:hypothetical protein